MYFVKTPWYLKCIYPSLTWEVKNDPRVFLTFDDGPVPGVTDQILDILDEYGAKATFFCIGDNVIRHKTLYDKIHANGHVTGNHTFHHLNGWRSENRMYCDDVFKCSEVVRSDLFRPPYGRISYNQIQELKKDFKIIMWDVLSGDFDEELKAEKCVNHVLENSTAGSIVVFHDSEKAKARVLESLPLILKSFSEKGIGFGTL